METNNKFDVSAFGESMLKLSVAKGYRLENTKNLDLDIGGAETNFLAGLAALNRKCAWFSKLPNNPTGKFVVNKLRALGINTEAVIFAEGRIGTYYVEYGAIPRATQVYYDRKDSCINNIDPAEVNWDYFLDTKYVHITGITPALSRNCELLTLECIRQAKIRHIKISFDINYRSKLWTKCDAYKVLMPMIQDVDVLFCNRRDAENIFDIHGSDQEIVSELQRKTNAGVVVTSLSDKGVIAIEKAKLYSAQAFPVEIVDRLGAGDALAAGVIHGLLDSDLQKGLEHGTALAALSMSMHGDMLYSNPEEISQLMKNKISDLAR